MYSSFLLALREGIEAALVVGIVLGALRQLQRTDCTYVVWMGVVSATLVSVIAAVFLNVLGWNLAGRSEAIFEGVMLLLAAGLLTWMIVWLRQQSKYLRGNLESGVRQAVCSPGHRGLFVLTFIAVAREGIELALFLTAASFETNAAQTLAGACGGMATAVLLAALLFNTTARLNLQRFFQVSTALLILFAAGMIATAVHEFNEVGWIPPVIDPLWNTEGLLSKTSTGGALLKGILGYTSTPSLTSVLAYVIYLGAIVVCFLRPTRGEPTAAKSRSSLPRRLESVGP
jgi:high-affinity iron transporter